MLAVLINTDHKKTTNADVAFLVGEHIACRVYTNYRVRNSLQKAWVT